MARNGSGFFNKMLNVIGIVDEPREQDQFDNRYASGRTANSRPSTYVPRQQVSRTADARRRTVVQDERTNTARYNAAPVRNTYNNINEGYTVRRAGVQTDGFDDADRSSNRRGENVRRNPEPAAAPAPRSAAPAPRTPAQNGMAPSGGRARTVMFNIVTLGECSKVVDALIAGNIVLIILEQLDNAMIQRVVDTLSGATFALRATIRKASDRTYLIAPFGVEVNDIGYAGRG